MSRKIPASEYMKYDKYIGDEEDMAIDIPIKHESKPYLMVPLPDGATNGDVIKALFPNYRTDEMSHSVWVGYDDMSFRREWWNAPYKREGE